MKIKRGKTVRGFDLIVFEDRYKQKCSIQESSLAEESAIWFGVDDTGPLVKGPGGEFNEEVGMRMHLTVSQVEKLLPILEQFAKTGEI